MYGWINDCVEALVLENFGSAVWKAIKEKAAVKERDGEFIRHQYYDDASTYALVAAAAEVLNLTPAQVLDTFGGYFVTFVAKAGYDKLMRAQGSNLHEFLSNMNAMHFTLQGSGLEQLVPPDFACELVEGQPDELLLHYWSQRQGLAPMVPGIIRQCAADYFNVAVVVEDLGTTEVVVDGGASLQYTKFHLKHCGLRESALLKPPPAAAGTLATTSAEAFATFPFHCAFGDDLRVLHAGSCLVAFGAAPGVPLSTVCTVEYPRGASLSSLRAVSHSFVRLRFATLVLHGGVVPFPGGLVFLGNPDADTLSDLLDLGFTLADIPVHDSYRKALFHGERVRAELLSAKRMEEVNVELSRATAKQHKVKMAARTRNAMMQLTVWSILLSLMETYDIVTDWLSFN